MSSPLPLTAIVAAAVPFKRCSAGGSGGQVNLNLTEGRLTCVGRCREAKGPFSVWKCGETGEGYEGYEARGRESSALSSLLLV